MNTSHVLKHDDGKYFILPVKETFVCILEGSRHDAFILGESWVMAKLEQHAFVADGTPLCIYEHSAYQLRIHIQTPFCTQPLTQMK